jgi:ubiquitin-conjugating enzyme E2 C
MATDRGVNGAAAARPKEQGAEQPSIDSKGQLKRLQSELGQLMMSGDPGISAFPGESLLRWTGTIEGPDESVYAGLSFKLNISFPADYPYSPPQITFASPIFHPNVDQNGAICLDILQDKWSAIYNVRTTLLSIRSLLTDPNNQSPLNTMAAQMWSSPEEFKVEVKKRYVAPDDVAA